MNVAILGAGAWGTAMALHLHRLGHRVTLTPRRMEQALAIASTRANADYLPGFELPHDIQVGCELRPVLMEARLVVLACPSVGLRTLCEGIRPYLNDLWAKPMVLALCKGLDPESARFPTDVMTDYLPELPMGMLSGPSYAADVARGQPTALVLAAKAAEVDLLAVQEALSSPTLRVYRTEDIRGVEIGGSLKNVYAIAAGISDGLGLGDNARAALLTRSLSEMVRLGTAWGGRAETFYGLSGFGDLVATSHGEWSRNRRFGLALGEGASAQQWLGSLKGVVEGHNAASNFARRAQADQLEAPILTEVCAVVQGRAAPGEALTRLMQRDLKAED
ncbi:MAG: NAD(P)H-dependent glycerol-3-phosphate dehydrogenase [Opitutales bacterium]